MDQFLNMEPSDLQILNEENLFQVYETPIKIIKTDDLNIYSMF